MACEKVWEGKIEDSNGSFRLLKESGSRKLFFEAYTGKDRLGAERWEDLHCEETKASILATAYLDLRRSNDGLRGTVRALQKRLHDLYFNQSLLTPAELEELEAELSSNAG